MTHTHSYAIMQVLNRTYQEIEHRMRKAGYAHAIDPDGLIDMHGVAIQKMKKHDGPRATLEEAERIARSIGIEVIEAIPAGWGFTILLSSLGEAGFSTYMSSIDRQDTVKLLREMADKIENHAPEV